MPASHDDMTLRRFLIGYTAALSLAVVIAFLRHLHPEWQGVSVGNGVSAGATACCPWGEKQPTQTGVLRVPREMRNGQSDLVVVVADVRAAAESLRIIGNRLLERPDSWVTVRVPLADRIEIQPIGQLFGVAPLQPEERRGILRSKEPLVWSWEIHPTRPGRLLLFLVGDAWAGSKRFWFTLSGQRIQVSEPFLDSVKSFLGTVPDWLTILLALPLFGWIRDRWTSRRRSQRPAGFGR